MVGLKEQVGFEKEVRLGIKENEQVLGIHTIHVSNGSIFFS